MMLIMVRIIVIYIITVEIIITIMVDIQILREQTVQLTAIAAKKQTAIIVTKIIVRKTTRVHIHIIIQKNIAPTILMMMGTMQFMKMMTMTGTDI